MNIGDKINYLTLKEIYTKKSRPHGIFECDCGTIKELRVNAVSSGSTKSCGCHRKKTMSETGKKVKTHGLSYDYIYKKWVSYLQDTNMTLCDEWKDFTTFHKDVGYRLDKTNGLITVNHSEPLSLTNYQIVSLKEAKNIKTQLTSLKKYGTNRPSQNQEVQKKVEATNLDKYGFGCVLSSPKIKEKIKQTNIEKYGEDHHMKTEHYMNLARQRTIDLDQANVYDGKTGKQWADEIGLTSSAMNRRIRKFGIEKAVTMPKYQSGIETIMEQFLSSLNVNFIKQYPVESYYADFFLPDHKIAIECDGLYWHSDIKKTKNYHWNKKKVYTERGFRSFFFYEDEIEDQLEIVQSIVKNAISINNRVFARKCDIKELDVGARKNYFTSNHLMGVGRGKALGLIYDDEIVCALQYLTKDYVMNIERFCPKINTSVVGGFTRLLKHAEVSVEHTLVKTYIDLRYGKGEYLEGLGFRLENVDLSFNWIKNESRVHRLMFPGNSGYDDGWSKLWDCGQARWTKLV